MGWEGWRKSGREEEMREGRKEGRERDDLKEQRLRKEDIRLEGKGRQPRDRPEE